MELVASVPGGDLVTPPELARDAPGPDLAQPAQVDPGPGALGMEAHATLLDDLDGRLGQFRHVAEPLERDQRLDPHARAVRMRHVVDVRTRSGDEPLLA